MFSLVATLPQAEVLKSSQGALIMTQMADGIDTSWAIAFLPDNNVLVTDRGGDLYILRQHQKHRIMGTPRVVAQGQGGLLDVMVPRDFSQSREIFLTFSKRQKRGSGTALAVAEAARWGPTRLRRIPSTKARAAASLRYYRAVMPSIWVVTLARRVMTRPAIAPRTLPNRT